MDQIAPIIAALTTLATATGAGVRFLWVKIERRFTRLEAEVSQCEAGRSVQLTVIELLWAELARIAPDAPVLARAKKLLDGLRLSAPDIK